ncbi:MAG: hypothetical protein HUJ51_03605 [Eggerthellaceae bacterium]|nr:hypothetical protein [Eggerthellaceae bacterium]
MTLVNDAVCKADVGVKIKEAENVVLIEVKVLAFVLYVANPLLLWLRNINIVI